MKNMMKHFVFMSTRFMLFFVCRLTVCNQIVEVVNKLRRSISNIFNLKKHVVFIAVLFLNTYAVHAFTLSGVSGGVKYVCSEDVSGELTIGGGSAISKYEWYTKDENGTKNILLENSENYKFGLDLVDKTIYIQEYRNGVIYGNEESVEIRKAPQINITSIARSEAQLCKNQSITLSSRLEDPTYEADITYEWSKNDSPLGEGSSIEALESGNYSVRANYKGCYSNSQTIFIEEPKSISISGNDGLCAGGQLKIKASGMDTYKWNDGSTNANKTITAEGEYTIYAESGNCKDTMIFEIKQKEQPPLNIEGPMAFCPGENEITLSASVGSSSVEDWDIEWKKDGIFYSSNPEITITEEGEYSIEAINKESYCRGSARKEIGKVENVNDVVIEKKLEACSGHTEYFTAKGDGLSTFEWYKNGLLVGQGKQHGISDESPYQVIGYTSDGCKSEPLDVQITLIQSPALVLRDVAPCEGETVFIEAEYETGMNFEWVATPDGAVKDGDKLTVTESGRYRASVTDPATKCKTEEYLQVEFLPYPTIDLKEDTAYCKGENITISAGIDDIAEQASFKWMDESGAVIKQRDNSFTPKAPGTYTFFASNEHNCESKKTITVKELEVPTLTITGTDKYLCGDGDSIAISVSGADSYLWDLKDNKTSTSSEIKIGTAGSYQVTGYNDNGCSSTTIANISSKAPVNLAVKVDTICEGESGYIRVTADRECDYLWTGNNTTGSELEVSKSGIYELVATDKTFKCVTKENVKVEVRELPKVKISPDNRFDSICQGESRRINLQNVGFYDKIKWEDGSTSAYRTLKTSGEYIVTATNRYGCQNSDTIDLYVNPLPEIQIEGPDSICKGDELTLILSGADSYIAGNLKLDGNVLNEVPVSSKTYKVVGYNSATKCSSEVVNYKIHVDAPFKIDTEGAKSICDGDSSVVRLSGATSFEWNKEGGANVKSDSIIIKEGGKYYIKAEKENSTCVVIDSFEAKIEMSPVLDEMDDTFYCESSFVELKPQNANSYRLFFNGNESNGSTFKINESGTYKIVGYSIGECVSDTIEVNVTEKKNPIITFPDRIVLCEDSFTTIKATVSGDAPFAYQWNIQGNKEESIKISTSGNYEITVTDMYGCTQKAEVDVLAQAPTISIKGNDEFCTDSTITLVGGGDASSYNWKGFQDGNELTVSVPGVYQLTGFDEDGCRTTITKEVKQRSIPTLQVPDSVSFCQDESVLITAQMESQASKYSWNGGAAVNEKSFSVNEVGNYIVRGYDELMCPTKDYEIKVSEILKPEAKITGKDYVCEDGEAIELQGEAAAKSENPILSYRWNTGATIDKISTDVAGIYTLIVSDRGCESLPAEHEVMMKNKPTLTIAEGTSVDFCERDSVIVHAQSSVPVAYLWSDGSRADTLAIKAEGKYSLVVEDELGCKNNIEIESNEKFGPKLQLKGEKVICQYTSTLLEADCPECETIVWNTGEVGNSITISEAGEYYAIGYNSIGCAGDTVFHTLEIRPAPLVAIEGETELSSNDSTVLTASVEGNGKYTYYWTPTHETSESILVKSTDFDFYKSYSVTVFDEYGCYNFAVVQINKHTVKINGEKEFCDGDSTELIAVGNEIKSYKWSNGSTEPSIVISSGGLYSLVTEHNNGIMDTIKFEVVEHKRPTLHIEGPNSLCSGDSILLMAKGDSSRLRWNTGTTNDSIWVRAEGEYTLTATSEFNCTSTDTLNITEYPLPSITIVGSDTLIEGESIFLEAVGAKTYKWESPDTVANRIEVFEGGRYRVVGTDKNGCKNSNVHDVRIVPIPHILINDTINGIAIVCEDEEFKLIASGAEYYRWDTGETTDTILAKESRIYVVEGCLSNGQCRKNSFTINISPKPIIVEIKGENLICPDSTTLLTVNTTDDDLISQYEWSNGLSGKQISVSDTGLYSVRAISRYGCYSTPKEKLISFYETPQITFDGSYELCDNSEVTIAAKGGVRYEWLGEGINANSITVKQEGEYTVRAWNEYGCAADSSVYVKNIGTPQIEIEGRDFLCQGDSLVLSVKGDRFVNNYFKWNTGEDADSIMVFKGGEYSVELSNRGGCVASAKLHIEDLSNPIISIQGKTEICQGDSARLSSLLLSEHEIKDYLWNDGSKESVLYAKAGGTYKLQATDINGCRSNTAEHNIEINIPSPVSVSGDFHLCEDQGDTATVKAFSSDAIFYTWIDLNSGDTLTHNNPTFSTDKVRSVRVLASNSHLCASYKDVEFIKEKSPIFQIIGAEHPVCNQPVAVLTAKTTEELSYHWNTGSTNQQIEVEKSGEYILRVTNKHNCYATDTVNLILNDIPDLSTTKNYSFCPGESTDIYVSGANTYLWSNGSTSNHAVFSTEDSAFVIATDQYGCTKRIDFKVTQFHVPEITMLVSPTNIERTDPLVSFDVTSTEDLSDCIFEWHMGDDNIVTEQSFEYKYDITNQRVFHAGLVMNTVDGCKSISQVTISCDLNIPNTITPNGDGVNDVFMKGCVVQIFDRQGALLHEGDDGWDGYLPSGDITPDTYYYVLTDITGEIYRGYITVRK